MIFNTNNNVIDSLEEIKTNELKNQPAGALAVKELNSKFDYVDISEDLLVVDGIGSSMFFITARERNKQISISFGVDFTESTTHQYVAKINKSEYCPQTLTTITTIGVDSKGVYYCASGFVRVDGRIYFTSETECTRAYFNLQFEI